MQVPLHTLSSVEAYIGRCEWRSACLPVCPLHSTGGCSFARHGSYARATPAGLRVARWYCPQGHRTFSLLPDFLAARLPGLLSTIEEVVTKALAARTMEAAADALREADVTLPTALRWLRRRVRPVCAAIEAVLPTSAAVFTSGLRGVLHELRRTLPEQVLWTLPTPLGILRAPRASGVVGSDQHNMGPDTASSNAYGGGISNIARTTCVPCRCRQRPPSPRLKTWSKCGGMADL